MDSSVNWSVFSSCMIPTDNSRCLIWIWKMNISKLWRTRYAFSSNKKQMCCDFHKLVIIDLVQAIKVDEEVIKVRRDMKQRNSKVWQCDKEDESILDAWSLPSSPAKILQQFRSFLRMGIVKFDGDQFEWKHFWELFKSMLERECPLIDAKKIFYWRSSIKYKNGLVIMATLFVQLFLANYSI